MAGIIEQALAFTQSPLGLLVELAHVLRSAGRGGGHGRARVMDGRRLDRGANGTSLEDFAVVRDRLERLRDLDGDEYERIESDSWTELQRELRRLERRRASLTQNST